MTIANRPLNRRLSNLQVCAQQAPEGTYEDAKELVETMNDIMDGIMRDLSAAGVKVSGDDKIRNLEVALYEYILSNNPNHFASAEGFGEHVDGPAGKRILVQAINDRNAFQILSGNLVAGTPEQQRTSELAHKISESK